MEIYFTFSAVANGANASANGVKGPDEEKIKEILERTGYTLDVTTGQRKYGGPPPGWEGEPPSSGCEVRNFWWNNFPLFLNDTFISPGFLWQNPARHVRERADSAVRKVRRNLGFEVNDGSHDRSQQRLRICHVHHPRRCSRGCSTGKITESLFFLE